MIKRLVLMTFVFWPLQLLAEEERALSLNEVLRSSVTHSPQIIEALARIRQAEGRALTASGAFDTVFDFDTRNRVAGFYDSAYASTRAIQPLSANGGQVYAGYRVSSGTFPIYEDEAYTDRLGELKIGALFSLLRDRAVDERRGRTALAARDIDVARLDHEMVAIGVQARAVTAYQNWAAAGLRLRAYQSLLELAATRRAAIARKVQLGARPTILLTETDQNIVRRQALVVRSEQEFAVAANALSFFYRDDAGERVTPSTERLPLSLPVFRPSRGAGPVDRPDLRSIDARLRQSQLRLALAENDMKPRLDLRGELSYDIGETGPGGRSRDGEDAIVDLRFSMPLERRQAQGRIAEARAEIDALRTRQRLISDQIAVEVEGITLAVQGAERLASLAADEADLADRLAAGERNRFELGASDLFLLNLREEAATDARVRLLEAQTRAALAGVDLAAATANRAALGLRDDTLP